MRRLRRLGPLGGPLFLILVVTAARGLALSPLFSALAVCALALLSWFVARLLEP
ncbi:MAG: hypothetical protein SFW67_13475 [Myxococcaceae bacterium]|nr:hypothetical protein [Myxococcaceae bacterium]